MKPTPQAYDELQTAYDHFNRELFGDELPPCLITLQREKRTCGYFSPKRFVGQEEEIDEIALNPVYFGRKSQHDLPHQESLQTLVHEMVHLWQSHFGDPGRARYHNSEWARKMESIGLMPSSTGAPGGKKTGDSIADYAIEGGKFLDACKKLLDEQFIISWRDRFAVYLAIETGQSIAIPSGGNSIRLPGPPKPKTRVKFTCPECGANAWGKPSLRLVCGDCDVALESTE